MQARVKELMQLDGHIVHMVSLVLPVALPIDQDDDEQDREEDIEAKMNLADHDDGQDQEEEEEEEEEDIDAKRERAGQDARKQEDDIEAKWKKAYSKPKFDVQLADGGSTQVEMDGYGCWHEQTFIGWRQEDQHDKEWHWNDTEDDEWDETYKARYAKAFAIRDDTDVFFLKSDKGTGKNHQLVSLLEVIIKRIVEPFKWPKRIAKPTDMPQEVYDVLLRRFPDDGNPRIVLASTRITYTMDMLRRLAKLGFRSYLDDPSHCFVICQMESLYKVTETPDLFVLDESETIFPQIVSGLNKERIHENTETFRMMFKHAKLKLCLDGDLGRKTFEVCRALETAGDQVVRVRNTYKTARREIILHRTLQSIRHRLLQSLAEGKKVFVGLGTVRDGRWILARVGEMFPNMQSRFYHREATKEVLGEFTRNGVAEVWNNPKIKLVMATSKLMCGVDYSVGRGEPPQFDQLFMFMTNNSVSPREYDQMSHRVRQFRDLVCNYYISMPYAGATGVLSASDLCEELERGQHKITADEAAFCKKEIFLVPGCPIFRWKCERTWIFLCYLYTRLESNLAHGRFLETFVQLCHRQGYTFEFVDATPTKKESQELANDLTAKAELMLENMDPQEKAERDAKERVNDTEKQEQQKHRDSVEDELREKSIDDIQRLLGKLCNSDKDNRDLRKLARFALRYPNTNLVPRTWKAYDRIGKIQSKVYRNALLAKAPMNGIREHDKRTRNAKRHRENKEGAKKNKKSRRERKSYMPLLEAGELVHPLAMSLEKLCAVLEIHRVQELPLAPTLLGAKVTRRQLEAKLPQITELCELDLIPTYKLDLRGKYKKIMKDGESLDVKQASTIISAFTNKCMGWRFHRTEKQTRHPPADVYRFVPKQLPGLEGDVYQIAKASTYGDQQVDVAKQSTNLSSGDIVI
jgi:hypothetical protein